MQSENGRVEPHAHLHLRCTPRNPHARTSVWRTAVCPQRQVDSTPQIRMDKTLLKGLHVLEAVAHTETRGGTAREIAELTGLSLCNIQRTLRTLLHADFIYREHATNRYFTGSKVLAMGARSIANLDVRHLTAPFLTQLSHATSETAFLALLDGKSVLCIDSVITGNRLAASIAIGATAPAGATAAGSVILSANNCASNPRLEPPRVTVTTGGWHPGIREVAAAIYDGFGNAKAAIGVFAPEDRVDDTRSSIIISHVLEAATAISQQWGCSV